MSNTSSSRSAKRTLRLGIGAILVGSLSSVAGAQTRTKLHTLRDTVLPVINASTPATGLNPKELVHLAIGLKAMDMPGLVAYADAANNPSSPIYRHWLTPKDVGDSFGASPADVKELTNYLTAQGMKVVLVPDQRLSLLVDGTVEQIQKTFSTTIKQYAGPDPNNVFNQITYRANSTPLNVPEKFGGLVTSVYGVENYTRPQARTTQLNPFRKRGVYGGANAWNLGFKGLGTTVGISSWDGVLRTNASSFITNNGLSIPRGGILSNLTFSPTTGISHNGTTAGQGEGDLDLQMVLSCAPLATIIVYDGTSSGNVMSILTNEANQNLADIITESYGWPYVTDAVIDPLHAIHVAMSAQGQTYMLASGDHGTHELSYWNGSAVVNGHNPFPDFDPDVLQVGGTIADADPVTGARISEVGWWDSGSGFWCSTGGYWNPALNVNVLPSWQFGTGVPFNVNRRLVPDIALHAEDDQIWYGSGFVDIGGTSASSPSFASLLAAMESRLAESSGTNTYRMGRIADLIYGMDGRSDVWYDITSSPGSIGTLATGVSVTAAAGWDYETGWGAPNMEGFFQSFFVKGTVNLGDWPQSKAQPVTLTVFNSNGNSVQTVSTTLDANGNFAFMPSFVVPDGTYLIRAKASHWLTASVSGVMINRNHLPQNLSFNLVNGDVNGDNVIGSADLTLVRIAFGSTLASADMNGDGNVGSADLTIVRKNFGQSGY